MVKNIVRWTIGHNVLPIAFDVLALSVRAAMRALAGREIEWRVCYNAPEILPRLRNALAALPVEFCAQNWAEFPLPLAQPGQQKLDALADHRTFSGSVWKLCPPRLDSAAYELALDNDVILWENCEELDRFWAGEKVLLAQDPIRAFGCFDGAHAPQTALNSGLVGLPPGFDITQALWRIWAAHGSPRVLNYLDEQGLFTASALDYPAEVLGRERFMCLHADYYSANLWNAQADLTRTNWQHYSMDILQRSLSAPITHFCQVNRCHEHKAWQYHIARRRVPVA